MPRTAGGRSLEYPGAALGPLNMSQNVASSLLWEHYAAAQGVLNALSFSPVHMWCGCHTFVEVVPQRALANPCLAGRFEGETKIEMS